MKSTALTSFLGLVALTVAGAALAADPLVGNLGEFYLGGGGEQRKSFKNLKSYKRRKRWL